MAEVKSVERPLSPHLQIYKPMMTMMMSIMHRITGAGLYFGFVILVWWLLAAAISPSYFDFVSWLMNTWIGWLVLLGFTWALFHHMMGGFRHFIWDFGYGFGPMEREVLAFGSLVGSGGLTVLVWAAAWFFMG